MAFTATGDTLNPSAAYAPIDAIVGVGPWNVVAGGTGAAQDDGFTSYKSQVGNPPRTRWGDYGAAAVDGNSIWIASEYIADTCNYTDWGGPFFVGWERRQPARYLRRREPWARHARRARQLVDADQQADALTFMGDPGRRMLVLPDLSLS